MAEIVIFSNVERQYQHLEQAHILLERAGLLPDGCKSLFFSGSTDWGPKYIREIEKAKAVFFIWQGKVFPNRFSEAAQALLQGGNADYGIFSSTIRDIEELRGVTEEDAELMSRYLTCSGIKNYQSLWLWLDARFRQGGCQAGPPEELPWYGIISRNQGLSVPDRVGAGDGAQGASTKTESRARSLIDRFGTEGEGKGSLAKEENGGRPVVGILFSRENWLWQDTEYLWELVDALERRELDVLPVYCLWSDNAAQGAPGAARAVRELFYRDGACRISALVNTFKVEMTRSSGNDPDFLKELNVPVLQGYNLLGDYQRWWDSYIGMDTVELSCNVVEPEFDGVIHGGPLSTKEYGSDGNVRYAPVAERIEAYADKVKKWIVLSRKENRDKRIAIIFHNYPPTNDSIGSAQGLDSFASVIRLLEAMQKSGYVVDQTPESTDALCRRITSGITNDRRFLTEQQLDKAADRMPGNVYRAWFSGREEELRTEMEREWGPAPGTVFLHDGSLVIPGIFNGNVYIGMQPPRGFGEDPGKIIHSPACPPPHHYLAFYTWLRETWQADAVIHIGTHGSLEWLPGKNAGLSAKCYPDAALRDLPDIYPYYVTIVGEGIQAKRRGSACLIGHLNPPSSHAGVYEDLDELEKLLDEYSHYKIQQPGNEGVVREKILEKIRAMHLEEDIPQEEGEEADAYILKIHTYVERLKHMQIRTGLHILGQAPENEELVEYILVLTRVENGAIPSLPKTIAAAWGYDYYRLEQDSGRILENGETGAALLDKIWTICAVIVKALQAARFAVSSINTLFALPACRDVPFTEELREDLRRTAAFICTVVAPNLALTKQEITNTLRALDGEYVEPGPGGAPTSGRVDILPTGRNFYGVDPLAMPTPTAWELGQTLADQAVSRFIREEGRYPESIGIILWSDSNMRSQGQCIAEVLSLLGVKPVWQRGSQRVTGLELIPLEELKRPRIDVTMRISGLFRDSLSAAVELLEKAVGLAAGAEETEENNFVRRHIAEDMVALQEEGLSEKEAFRQAGFRIFGCPPGSYGAGVAHMLEEKNWESADDLGDVYVRWGAHVYGQKAEGRFLPSLFRRRLKTVEITIKNIDNHEVHLLNSDDFNAYCGGLNAAVRSIRGQMPRCYIGDSADRSRTETRSLGEEFRRVFRGESMNPKYLEGMKKYGYKGASDLVNLVVHAFGWDATSSVMEDWMYEGFAKKIALDRDMQSWMRQVNPWALYRLAAKLLEANQRHMWEALPETREALKKLYMEIEGEIEDRNDE